MSETDPDQNQILLIQVKGGLEPCHMDDSSIKYIDYPHHYELHFDKRVEFWTLDGRKLGESNVEPVD